MAKVIPPTTRSLPFALVRARENVMRPIRLMLAESHLTEQQWRVLRVLSELGPQDATEVADRACLLLPSLTRILQSLSKKGLISQTQNKTDRRRQILKITPEGEKIIDDNRQQAARIAASFTDRVGAEDYEKLLELLEAFSEPFDIK